MNGTDSTQIQFPLPGQRRPLVCAAIAAALILLTVVGVGRATTEHRATPAVHRSEAVAAPIAVLDTNAPDPLLTDWELQAAVDDFCVTYRYLFDADIATGERALPHGCSGAITPTGRETSGDLEFGIDDAFAIVPR